MIFAQCQEAFRAGETGLSFFVKVQSSSWSSRGEGWSKTKTVTLISRPQSNVDPMVPNYGALI